MDFLQNGINELVVLIVSALTLVVGWVAMETWVKSRAFVAVIVSVVIGGVIFWAVGLEGYKDIGREADTTSNQLRNSAGIHGAAPGVPV